MGKTFVDDGETCTVTKLSYYSDDEAVAHYMFKGEEEYSSVQVVTPAGYCIHSTVVPAIVPNIFRRELRESMGRNYCFPMVGGAKNRWKSEADDRPKFGIH